jgi:hypothetical protein
MSAPDVGLPQHRPARGRATIRQEDRSRRGKAAEPLHLPGQRVVEALRHGEAIGRQATGRLQQPVPSEPPEATVRLRHPGDGAGDPGGQMTRPAGDGDPSDLFHVHVAPGRERRSLPEVQGRFSSIRRADDHEAAASEVASLRIDDGEGEMHGHGRVDGIASLSENRQARGACQAVRAHDHPPRARGGRPVGREGPTRGEEGGARVGPLGRHRLQSDRCGTGRGAGGPRRLAAERDE